MFLGDQTGEGMSNTKHVYPNPLRPDICAILALAVYIFSTPRVFSTGNDNNASTTCDSKLFEGSNQKSRWTDILAAILESLPEDIDLGCKASDGTYLLII